MLLNTLPASKSPKQFCTRCRMNLYWKSWFSLSRQTSMVCSLCTAGSLALRAPSPSYSHFFVILLPHLAVASLKLRALGGMTALFCTAPGIAGLFSLSAALTEKAIQGRTRPPSAAPGNYLSSTPLSQTLPAFAGYKIEIPPTMSET